MPTNSDSGGAILLGVKEVESKDGKSSWEIKGAHVGDRAKQAILSKCESCVPAVQAALSIQNTQAKPFWRVEIPSGPDKPYCTSGGTYKIRGDGRNKAMTPGLLLSMFVERESQEFLGRFQEATRRIEMELEELRDDILQDLRQIDESTGRFSESVADNLSEIGGMTEEAYYESESASSAALEIGNRVQLVAGDVVAYGSDIEAKLDGILRHMCIPDPAVSARKDDLIVTFWSWDRDGVSKDEASERFSRIYPAATAEQFEEIYKGMQNLVVSMQKQSDGLMERREPIENDKSEFGSM